MIVPDHYSKISTESAGHVRHQLHALDPLPFALWDDLPSDSSTFRRIV
jgi:hypothetical protein